MDHHSRITRPEDGKVKVIVFVAIVVAILVALYFAGILVPH